mgnify:CR=1 FL=1
MKKFKTTICLLMLLSVAITAVMLQFMPDIVPAHYNAAGEVDRLGSKYESILFPAATALMGLLFLLMNKFVSGYGNEKDREIGTKAVSICGILTVLYFIAMGIYFMSKNIAYGHSGTASIPGIDLAATTSICTILIGAVLIILGNYMPKARVNALYGLRTKWSMSNDRVWQKSQRFGGFSSVICGIVLILLGVFVKNSPILWMLLILLIWSFSCILSSYAYYRKDCISHKNEQI